MVQNDSFQIKKNTVWIIFFMIIAILLFWVFTNDGRSFLDKINPSYNQNNIESCPYDCCLGGAYQIKQCSKDYECLNNKCSAVDTDNDGLTDIQERNIGTNPQLYDTDGDTLNDYQEYTILKTNPLKRNTDGDRYDDNEDKQPTIKNTAKIHIQEDFNSAPNYVNIALLAFGIGALSSNLELYSTEVQLNIINDGSDYSSYGSYDIVILIGNDIIDSRSISFGRVDMGSSIQSSTSFSTTLKDIPTQIISLITQQETPKVEIRNLEYEKF